MSVSRTSDELLVERVRRGEPAAWEEFIARYEGRLTAFVQRRLHRRDEVEDLVQDAFVGFLQSLPNYDSDRPLESYLLTIAAYKLTDHLRKLGRRPSLLPVSAESSGPELPGPGRRASSLLQSRERHEREEEALASALAELLQRWQAREDWEKIRCFELLMVRGWGNKQVADRLGLTEQRVASIKHEAVARLRQEVSRRLHGGTAPREE